MKILTLASVLVLGGCGGSSDWIGGGMHTVEGKTPENGFVIEMPEAMTTRSNDIGVRFYLTDEDKRTDGPWIDVETAGFTPRGDEDLLTYSGGQKPARGEPDKVRARFEQVCLSLRYR